MSDERHTADGERGIDRRSVLGNLAVGAVGVGGLIGVGGASSQGPDIENGVRARGDLTPAEAIEKLKQLDEFDGGHTADDVCYTDTKCAGGCGTQGAVAYRDCCPNLGGCTDWTYTGLCC